MRFLSFLADVFRGRDYYGRYRRMYRRDLRKIPSFNLVLQLAREKVLDVGCGIGYLSNFFEDYVGVDVSKEAISIARRNTRGNYVVASASNLPFCSNTFNSCILYDFIEHVDVGDVDQVLAEVSRVADEVIIGCVDFSSYYRFFTYDKSHKWLPTPIDLASAVRRFFARVQIFRTSGLFVLPRPLNLFLERFFPNQVVLRAWEKKSH